MIESVLVYLSCRFRIQNGMERMRKGSVDESDVRRVMVRVKVYEM